MGRFQRVVAGLLAAGAVAGCEGSPPSVDSSNTEATVKGVVKVDGAPATEGEIVFDASNYKRPDAAPRTAPIGKDGTYTIKTFTGANVARLGGALTKKKTALQYTKRPVNVTSGENTFDFVVGGDDGDGTKGNAAPAK